MKIIIKIEDMWKELSVERLEGQISNKFKDNKNTPFLSNYSSNSINLSGEI